MRKPMNYVYNMFRAYPGPWFIVFHCLYGTYREAKWGKGLIVCPVKRYNRGASSPRRTPRDLQIEPKF